MDDSDFDKLIAGIPSLTTDQHRRLRNAVERWRQERPIEASIDAQDGEDSAETVCPHCGSDGWQRWGRSGGLQRYRCKGCRRTFNRLTGTPLARLRKRERWPAYQQALADGSTVRDAARQCGVDPSTSFRWRHRFLAQLREPAPAPLTGIVEVAETRFVQADKGVRDLPRPVRRRGHQQHRGFSHPEHRVLVLQDRSGSGAELVLPAATHGRAPAPSLPHLVEDVLLCAADDASLHRALAEAGLQARLLPSGAVPLPALHSDHAAAYVDDLLACMARFHGVSSRYLENYLVWCRLLLQEPHRLTYGAFIAGLGNKA